MPISVNCPSCSAGFKVKDEYAGKRAKCPKCGEPLTIPAVVDTVLMPSPAQAATPVAARPVVASKPKPAPVPVDDEADEPPVSPKRKRGADDEDEEQPRAKKRARDDEDAPVTPKRKRGADDDEGATEPKRKRGASDDDDDAPVSPKSKRGASDDEDAPKAKRRRRDDDEDAPKKKSKALPIILGIVGGVLLLCGGGCAGVYFLVLKPLNDDLVARGSARMSMFDPPKTDLPNDPGQGGTGGGNKVTRENMNSLRAGMSLAQVEQLLGKGKAADEFELLRGVNGTTADQQWKAKQQAKAVYSWGGVQDVVLVAFSAPPTGGGTLVGVRGAFGIETLEPVKLPVTGGGTPTGGGKPVTPGNMALVNLGMTYAQVEAIFGPGRFADDTDMARLSNGTASNANWSAKKNEGSVVVWADQTNTIQVAFTAPNGGTVVGVRGLFGKDNAEPIPPPAPAINITAAALVKEWDANPATAEAKYKDKPLKVTGVVAVIPKEAVSFEFQGSNPPATKAAIAMPVNVPFGGWGPIKKMKVGDTVTVTCKFDSFAKNKNNVWELKLKDAVFSPK